MAVDMFLKIEGIPGESRDSRLQDWIHIESFSWGITPSSDDDKGKLSVGDFNFAKRMDKSSPILMLSCATGKHISDAVLTCRKAGEKPLEFLVIKMTDILISSYQTGGSSGDIVPTDSFSLNFGAINVEYTPQKDDGSPDKPVSAGFNVKEVKRG